MKGMLLPFDFDLELLVKNNNHNFDSSEKIRLGEPKSVLDSADISSRRTSSPILSSSLGGGAASTYTPSKLQQESTITATSGEARVDSELLPIVAAGRNTEKCSMEEDWETVLPDSSPEHEQSIFRWIIGDMEDPAMASLNKVLQIGTTAADGSVPAAAELGFHSGFAAADQGFAGDQLGKNLNPSIFSDFPNGSTAEKIDFSSNELMNLGATAAYDTCAEIKPPMFNPQFVISQHQAYHNQNPSFCLPFTYAQEQGPIEVVHGHVSKGSFWDTGQQEEVSMGKHHHQQFQWLPHQRPKPRTGVGDELGQQFHHFHHQHQQVIVDQLHKAAEMVQMGNPVLAQVILARLNHHISPVGNAFQRAAFYCKEALQQLVLLKNNGGDKKNNSTPRNPSTSISSPFNIIFKISAYKSFCEISPLVQFTNFTCNQALLEVLDGFDRIHVVDFDIGYGGQWASLMQELAMRGGGGSPPVLKITAFVSPSIHDQIELGLTRENLIQFAAHEISIGFEFEAVSIDSFNSSSWSLPFHVLENEAVAVNLPVGCLATQQLSPTLALQFVKQLSPRIVVSIDNGCERTDLPFASHVIHTLQSYSNLLESLNAVSTNMDSLQKIERFLLQPGIEKVVTGCVRRSPQKLQHWRTLFLSSGFSPVAFSNFTESQAECVVKRSPGQGFHVEKRQSSLVLCWQQKELVSATVWRCG